jgi:hypothetical protein
MTQGESRNEGPVDSIREAARQELAAAMRRIALDPDGTGANAPREAAPPSPLAGAKRTVAAPRGAPPPAAAPHADDGTGRGGAPGGAAARDGDAGRAARRAAFDRDFDRMFPELARTARPAPPPAAAAQPPRLQPRQLTAARLLLASWRVTDVAARLGIDRHTLADWMKDPAFQREVRRMAVELPVDELTSDGPKPSGR